MVRTVINNHPDVLSEVGVCPPDDMHMTNQCTFREKRSRYFYVFMGVVAWSMKRLERALT